MAFYGIGRLLGITAQIIPVPDTSYWWTIPVLIFAAFQNAADLVFSGEGLGAVVAALDVARSARRRALENFAFAALYNLIAAPAAMFGFINPFVAALAMSGSSLAVTLNALRTGRGKTS